jgi:deazaflavin-dependent oxidoreductase (nitroreductase family)
MFTQAQPVGRPPQRSGQSETRVPFFVSLFNPLGRRLLRVGLPLGPNALLTVRGRKTGQPRTTPVAVVDLDGRRWIIGTFGEVNWVQNLRAAGQATITSNRRSQPLNAVELSTPEATAFYRDTLGPYVRRIPLGLGRFMLGSVLGAGDLLTDPEGAAHRHPLFELRPRPNDGSGVATAPTA